MYVLSVADIDRRNRWESNQLGYLDTFFLLLILTVETAGMFRYVLFVADLLTVQPAGIFRYVLSVADIDRRNS